MPFAEVTRIFRLFGDVPPFHQAHAVGAQEPAKALAVWTPAEIRAESTALARLAELLRYNPARDVGERHLVDGKRRLTRTTPDNLVWIGKQCGKPSANREPAYVRSSVENSRGSSRWTFIRRTIRRWPAPFARNYFVRNGPDGVSTQSSR